MYCRGRIVLTPSALKEWFAKKMKLTLMSFQTKNPKFLSIQQKAVSSKITYWLPLLIMIFFSFFFLEDNFQLSSMPVVGLWLSA